jgi:magnesium transporter
VLKRLAGITIILQFPVLVASIYGMNVPIPYSETRHAFYVPIILALVISSIMAWYFVRKKWF